MVRKVHAQSCDVGYHHLPNIINSIHRNYLLLTAGVPTECIGSKLANTVIHLLFVSSRFHIAVPDDLDFCGHPVLFFPLRAKVL